jgi:hypothetical protein
MSNLAIGSLANNIPAAGIKQQVGISVLKTALNIESTAALTLIQAATGPNLPANLGNTINTKA